MLTNNSQKKAVYLSLLEATRKKLHEVNQLFNGRLKKATLIFSGTKDTGGTEYNINTLAAVLVIENSYGSHNENFDELKVFLNAYGNRLAGEILIIENIISQMEMTQAIA